MAGYPVNVGRIIATKMWDRALNERVGLPFPCLIGKLCLQSNIPPNKVLDRWIKAYKLTTTSKIKDVTNHLFGAKVEVVEPLAVVPHIPLDTPQDERGPEQGKSS